MGGGLSGGHHDSAGATGYQGQSPWPTAQSGADGRRGPQCDIVLPGGVGGAGYGAGGGGGAGHEDGCAGSGDAGGDGAPGIVILYYTLPDSSFAAIPTSGAKPLSVEFIGGGEGQVTWDFGDGGTDIGADPTHIYITSGNHTVILVARNEYGFSTSVRVNYIYVNLNPSSQGTVICPDALRR